MSTETQTVEELSIKLNSVSTKEYVRWDDPSVEHVPDDEAETIAKIVKQINFIQVAQATGTDKKYHYSGTHAKTHGVVKGTMTIAKDLPAHLAQSMFANGGKVHPMAMRYSSEPGVPLLDDRIPQPRGLGMKIFNVPGPKLRDDGKDPATQDLEFNSCPILELGSAKTAHEIIDLRITHGDAGVLSNALDERPDGDIQQIRNRMTNQHAEAQIQHSQSAFRFGDHVAKFCLVPSGKLQLELAKEYVHRTEHSSSILSEWLASFYKTNSAEYELKAQLCVDIEHQPVEDSRYEWDSTKYPFETIAYVTIPPQDSMLEARNKLWLDSVRVTPWDGLTTLQPLGSINRVRKDVYAASAALRRKANGVPELNISSVDDLP